MRIFTT